MSASVKNTELGQKLLGQFLEKLTARINSGEATAADFAVALKTMQAMQIEMVATTDNGAGALRKALTDSLPFAGSDDSPTYQ